nr:MAG TPA: hypothetical protein [Caudoviricetes sp.]
MANTIKNLGIVSPVPMGEWVSGIIYQKLNIVRHNGASYLAKQPTATEPGISSSWESYWQLIVKDGGNSVVQTTGTSLTDVMSQDAVTKQLIMVQDNTVRKQKVPYIVYTMGTDKDGHTVEETIPYRFQKNSIINPEYTVMFQPMYNGRLYTRDPEDDYHAANKRYVDNLPFKTLFGNQSITGTGNIDLFIHSLVITATAPNVSALKLLLRYPSSSNFRIDSLTDLYAACSKFGEMEASGYVTKTGKVYSIYSALCYSGDGIHFVEVSSGDISGVPWTAMTSVTITDTVIAI